MKRTVDIQYHELPLQMVRDLQKGSWGTIHKEKSPIDSIKARLASSGKEYTIKLSADFQKNRLEINHTKKETLSKVNQNVTLSLP